MVMYVAQRDDNIDDDENGIALPITRRPRRERDRASTINNVTMKNTGVGGTLIFRKKRYSQERSLAIIYASVCACMHDASFVSSDDEAQQ